MLQLSWRLLVSRVPGTPRHTLGNYLYVQAPFWNVRLPRWKRCCVFGIRQARFMCVKRDLKTRLRNFRIFPVKPIMKHCSISFPPPSFQYYIAIISLQPDRTAIRTNLTISDRYRVAVSFDQHTRIINPSRPHTSYAFSLVKWNPFSWVYEAHTYTGRNSVATLRYKFIIIRFPDKNYGFNLPREKIEFLLLDWWICN